MDPISSERHKWIEERLFILARTVQTLRADGLKTATRYFAESHHEAHSIVAQTMQDLNKERLALMMERQAIEEYFQERYQGAQDGS